MEGYHFSWQQTVCSFVVLLFLISCAAAQTSMPSVPVSLVTGSFSDWKKDWVAETEDAASLRYLPADSSLDVVASKGFTLWYKYAFEGDLTIRYEICAVRGGDTLDRCSDLNCFWMASDPLHPDSLFVRSGFRGGVFGRYYSLSLYYMGFGGNNNTTTRFRKYDGDFDRFRKEQIRPAVLTEFLDAAHLIVPNHWYKVEISMRKGVVQYSSDNEVLMRYHDPAPLRKGWFGFRTTENHFRIRRFNVSAVP
jgi:rhamnogalacturonan endolyase